MDISELVAGPSLDKIEVVELLQRCWVELRNAPPVDPDHAVELGDLAADVDLAIALLRADIEEGYEKPRLVKG